MKVTYAFRSITSQIQDGFFVKLKFLASFFLHYSTKKFFGRGICKFPRMNLKLYNSVFETRKNTIDFWTVSIPHEKEMTAYMVRKKEKGTLVDVGTHIGRYSILMAKKGWKIYSFEPLKTNFDQLNKNAVKNDVEKNITFYNLAVGQRKGKKEIFYDHIKHGEASLVMNPRLKEGGITSLEKTRVDSLDNLFPRKIKGEVVLKIDVEGFEYNVLEGAKKFIKKNMPEISIEIWPQNKEKTEKFLRDLGYKHIFGELWKRK